MNKNKPLWKTAAYSIIVFMAYMGYRSYRNVFDLKNFSAIMTEIAPLHLLDYSMGFLPRALSGQILTLLAPNITDKAVGIFLIAVNVLAYGTLCFILGKMLMKSVSTKNHLLTLFVVLFIFMPASVWSLMFFFGNINYDAFLLMFTLFAFLAIKEEKLQWLVPIFSCLAIMANYAYVLLLFPFIFAVLYYEYAKSGFQKTRGRNLAVTTLSSLLMEAYMIFAVMHSSLVSKYSPAEAIAYMENKIGHSFVDGFIPQYICGTVFGWYGGPQVLDKVTIVGNPEAFVPWKIVPALLFCAPVLLFTFTAWLLLMKDERGFLKKSPYILFMIAPLALIPASFVFMDYDRLAWGVIITQGLLLAHVYLSRDEAVFSRMKDFADKHRLVYIAFAVLILIQVIFGIWFMDIFKVDLNLLKGFQL